MLALNVWVPTRKANLRTTTAAQTPHTQVFGPKPVFIWTEILKGLETVG